VPGRGNGAGTKALIRDLRRQLGDRDRLLRIFRAHEQDFSERYRASPDADGIGGRPAVGWMRDKNLPYVLDLIYRAPDYPWLRPTDETGVPIPGTHPMGIRRAVPHFRQHVTAAIVSLWVGPLDHPFKVKLRHSLLRWLSDWRIKLMMRRSAVGYAECEHLADVVTSLAFGSSQGFVYRSSQEISVDPVEAERRPAMSAAGSG